jgi:hypothetical protein
MCQSVFPEDAESTEDADTNSDEDQSEPPDQASLENMAMNVTEYVLKALAKDFDPDKHPRAADGKFGSGGGEKPAAKPESGHKLSAAKTLAALHEASDHAKAAISKAVDITKYSAKAVAAAGKHVAEKVAELAEKHPHWTKVIVAAAVVAASEAVMDMIGARELGSGVHLGIATAADLCSDRIKDFAFSALRVAEKSLIESEPTDADMPEIARAGKALWDDIVSSFDVPKDALKDDSEKRIEAAVSKVVEDRLKTLLP